VWRSVSYETEGVEFIWKKWPDNNIDMEMKIDNDIKEGIMDKFDPNLHGSYYYTNVSFDLVIRVGKRVFE
jgi:hypothetical protein